MGFKIDPNSMDTYPICALFLRYFLMRGLMDSGKF